jgi:hypothetical protein
MKIRSTYLYIGLFIFQALACVYAFKSFFAHPRDIFFDNKSDGLKNYFTLYTYVNDETPKSDPLKYNRFNYPFGEYVYSLDNTPAFAIPFKWFCNNVSDISNDVLIYYNLFIILNILLASLLTLYIARCIIPNDLFALIAALVLPWVNAQVPRIIAGHYSLSLSSLVLLAMCLLYIWHQNRYSICKQLVPGIAMIVLCFVAFLMHGYYIAIIGLFIGGTLFFHGIVSRKETYAWASIAAGIIIPALAAGFAFLLMSQTDPYLALRKPGAMGYDYLEMKTRVYSLYTPYYMHTFFFPVRSAMDGNHEHAGYLGNIALYSCAVIGIISIRNKMLRQHFKTIQTEFFKDKFRTALALGGVMMLSVSMGELYATEQNGYYIYNFLNPFFYIHFFTKTVEQFRSLARFNWPFYFIFNFWVLYTLSKLYLLYNKKIKIIIIAVVMLLGAQEARDFINALREYGAKENLLAKSPDTPFSQLHINPAKYQAIIPIPYYNAGSEDYNYSIDDYEPWSLYSYQLSLHTGLPLMSSRLSRTPPLYTKAIMDLFSKDTMYGYLYNKLNDKPILIAYKQLYVDLNPIPFGNESARMHNDSINAFVKRRKLQPIDSLGDVHFYEWYPKKQYHP